MQWKESTYLGEAEIHHFIEQLVHDDEVITTIKSIHHTLPNTFLIKHTKVIFEHFHQIIQKLHHHGYIRVSLGQGEEVENSALQFIE